ncbi:hypothetical protein JXX19_08055 [Ruthenibacterium lactatiformans]|uniref:hypothetical protein n=1 Tax=Ruthenibacterium lactatiformans TaxID=1550024 RepID=UPI0019680C23|nr:hypothetical protein [Ruthenibacterium lactatiformans]MBN3026379.1 hypothetical protein [Ruthenibacterium lactatiformans]
MKQLKEAGIQHLFTVLCSLHHKHRCLLLLCRIFPKSFFRKHRQGIHVFLLFLQQSVGRFQFFLFCIILLFACVDKRLQFFRLFLQLLILFLQQIVILAQNFVFFFLLRVLFALLLLFAQQLIYVSDFIVPFNFRSFQPVLG